MRERQSLLSQALSSVCSVKFVLKWFLIFLLIILGFNFLKSYLNKEENRQPHDKEGDVNQQVFTNSSSKVLLKQRSK
jgi:putative Mn2+ efflux pump MntP